MTFAEKIKELRKSIGKSQEQVSKEMGIAISTLRNYENGRLPDTYQLKIIKNYFNVPYEYLLDDNCKNKDYENTNIGKKLNLSDEVINKILEINKYGLSEGFNYYIKHTPIYILEYFKNLQYLHSIKINYIDFFITIFALSEYIQKNINNKKLIDELLDIYDNKIKYLISSKSLLELESLIEFPIRNDFSIIEKSFKKITSLIKSGSISSLDYTNFANTIIEISRKFESYICFHKYSFSKAFDSMTEKIAPDLNDIYCIYYKDLDKYYEDILDIDCDYGFGKSIIKKARNKIKKTEATYIDVTKLHYMEEI